MMFNATFNNISAISWRSVLLVEETRVPGENYWPFVSHWQTYHIMLYRWHLAWVGFELTILVVIGTDCIGIKVKLQISWKLLSANNGIFTMEMFRQCGILVFHFINYFTITCISCWLVKKSVQGHHLNYMLPPNYHYHLTNMNVS